MQRYLQFDRLREAGLDQFDAWVSAFGEVVAAFEVAPDGSGYRVKNRFSRFHDMPELMTMFREVADIQTAEMLNLPTPKLKDGKIDIIRLARAPEYEELLDEILERSKKIHKGTVGPHEDNYLKLTMDARDGALDMCLVNPAAPDRQNSKVKTRRSCKLVNLR